MNNEDAARLRNEASAAEAAEAFQRGEMHLDYDRAGKVLVPPRPDSEPMVTRGLRLPVSVDQRVRQIADRTGTSFSALVREWIEVGLTESEDDQQVSLAAIRRAIAHAAQSGQVA